MRNIFRTFAVVVTAAAIGAGCSSSYKGLSKAEFVKQANAICTQGNKDADVVSKQITAKSTAADVGKLFTDKVAPILTRVFDQIDALKPPKADRDQVKKITSEGRDGLKKFLADVNADPKAAFSQATDPLKQSQDDAKAYGLTVCGTSSSN